MDLGLSLIIVGYLLFSGFAIFISHKRQEDETYRIIMGGGLFAGLLLAFLGALVILISILIKCIL